MLRAHTYTTMVVIKKTYFDFVALLVAQQSILIFVFISISSGNK